MNTFSQTVRRLILSVLTLVIFIGLLWWLYGVVHRAREQLVAAQDSILSSSQQLSAQSLMEKDLQTNKADTAALQAFVLQPDMLNTVIDRLQAEGDKQDVQVQVNDIKPQELPAGVVAGSFTTIQMRVAASGSPTHLLRFFQAVEHLPFLLRVATWRLSSQSTGALAGTASVGTAPIAASDGGTPTPTPTPVFSPSELELMVLLSVNNTPS